MLKHGSNMCKFLKKVLREGITQGNDFMFCSICPRLALSVIVGKIDFESIRCWTNFSSAADTPGASSSNFVTVNSSTAGNGSCEPPFWSICLQTKEMFLSPLTFSYIALVCLLLKDMSEFQPHRI